MVHGTSDGSLTWCGAILPPIDVITSNLDLINCLKCLRMALRQSCSKCKERKKYVS